MNPSSQTISGTVSAPAWTAEDLAFMAEARALGRLGAGRTWTNPMVGAVVVRDGKDTAGPLRIEGAHKEWKDAGQR